MKELLEAIALKYKSDPTGAGMVMAYIPSKKIFYCSVCRYSGEFGEGKEIIAKGTGSSLEATMGAVIQCWLESIGKNSLKAVLDDLQAGNKG